MLSRDRWFFVLIVILSALSQSVSTQSGQPAVSSPLASKPISSASRVTEAPSIDGTLDEGVWQTAALLTGFVQAEPFQGSPASEHTEVRILYDDEAIYVGVVLHDRNPALIVTTDTRRDANLGEMDSFQMIFDTFRDQQNGFVFGTNAAGVQYDARRIDTIDRRPVASTRSHALLARSSRSQSYNGRPRSHSFIRVGKMASFLPTSRKPLPLFRSAQHDLRRTASSGTAEAGISKVLNHAQGRRAAP
jgi:hypothetical protein